MSLRRQVRLRKEYMYRKSLNSKDGDIYDKKLRVREALRDGTPLPTELRADEATLRHEVRRQTQSRSSLTICSFSLTSVLACREIDR